ncbi:TPA: hypothetical protein I7295_04415 [Vibrio parahaemolyticus]|nr:hypothetical protein [Vibrio parahaemolyticus]HAS6534091.1 hypothetical protein [Vibrio parahaemolyticus]HAS6553791.1 hypothetical protein [Vibrio parahaemolyticus]HAS6558744.1 hypothetical protein [Vibrio parahaemolyticus]HAS6909726.1 hypothetical protein [Vibrio parahaemolyticus]
MDEKDRAKINKKRPFGSAFLLKLTIPNQE